MIEQAAEVLHRVFGFPAFYPVQEEAIRAILAKRDTLVVMPTGGGKSLCYQVPAMLLEGVTLVVSPLIALMKDQVEALERRGVAATFINSSLEWKEQSDRLYRMGNGEYKLVYVAPERLRNRAFGEALQKVKVAYIAIDEAHCISQWGHDFRPDYMRLRPVIEQLGRPLVCAFTATATPEVRIDIKTHLGMRDPKELVAGFERPNLRLSVRHVGGEQEKEQRLRAIISEHKTGIIYCATRKRVETVSNLIASWGVKTACYHGGMQDGDRDKAQRKFTDGKAEVVVATNAFGMGIDRSDVRLVIHYEIPGSLEAYYQEAGRAGRDGQPAVCELLFNFADTRVQEFFIDGSNPASAFIRSLFDFLKRNASPTGDILMSISDIAERMQTSNDMSLGAALSYLQRLEVIERYDVPGTSIRGTRVLKPQVSSSELEIDEEALREKERRDRAKLKSMLAFAYGTRCRQWMILDYFGEQGGKPCGTCDVCVQRSEIGERSATVEEHLVVRKFLSALARMCRRQGTVWEGRFGRSRLIQVTTGTKSEEVTRAGLEQLTTFGILHDKDPRYLNRLLDALAEGGLIEVGEEPYRLVSLTAAGEEAMRADACNYRLCWPTETAKTEKRKKGPPKVEAETIAPEDAALYGMLKQVRKDQATARGNVPAYTIFPDSVLKSLAKLKPNTPEAALQIKGIGPDKARIYLPPFLDAIRKAGKSKPI